MDTSPTSEQPDPLWLAAYWAVFLSGLALVLFHFVAREPLATWDYVFFLPLMLLGTANRIRHEGGNVTVRAREVLAGRSAAAIPYRSRSFAGCSVALYAAFAAVMTASYELSTATLVLVVAHGLVTAYVVAGAVLGREPEPAAEPESSLP